MAKEKAKKPERRNRFQLITSNSRKVAVFMAAFLFCIISDSNASINSFLELSSGFDDNPFYEQSKTPGYFISPSFGIGYFPDSLDIGFSANTRYRKFTEFNDRNYFFFNLQGSYSLELNSINYSVHGSYNTRRNFEDIEIYNYNQYLANLTINVTDAFGLSYIPRSRKYFNYNELSYFENKIVTNYYYKLSEKKALYFEAEINAKIFTDRFNIVDNQTETPNNKTKGKKARKRVGEIYEPGIMNYENDAYLSNIFINYIQNLNINTGLSASIFVNLPLFAENASILPGTAEINEDPELFDDEYSFYEFAPNLTLNKLLFTNVLVSLSLEHRIRNFLYEVDVINDDMNTNIRNDQRTSIAINAERTFLLDNFEIKIIMNYSFLKNSSNIDFFNFNNNMFTISTRITY